MERRMGALNCPHCRSKDYREVSLMKKNILVLQHLSESKNEPLAPCSEHQNLEATFFCLDENVPFCSRCATKHKKHDFYDIDDTVITQGTDKQLEEAKKKAEDLLSTAKSERDWSVNIFNKVEEKKVKAIEEIDKKFEPLLQAIDKKKKEFVMSLNRPVNALVKRIQENVEYCDDIVKKRQKTISDIDGIMRQISKIAGPARLQAVQSINKLSFEQDKLTDKLKTLEQEAENLNFNMDISLDSALRSVEGLTSQEIAMENELKWSPEVLPAAEVVHSNPLQVQLVETLAIEGLISTQSVRAVMETTDRKDFIPDESNPYEDRPQRIGFNTTISAPHMHAMTLSILEPWLVPGARVLDVGCGSGYLTVCMAKMIGRGKVYGIDHIEELINQAIDNIRKSNLYLLQKNDLEMRMVHRDGRIGLPEYAPFDVIHIGAATPEIPQPLLEQLAPGGVLMAPVGPISGFQHITIVKKDENGNLQTHSSQTVNYAPLTDRDRQCPS